MPVNIVDAVDEWVTVQNHPKNPDIGNKKVRTARSVIIDREDANNLIEGQNATFINWGNILIEKIIRENGVIKEIKAKLNLSDKNYKNTLKLTWIAVDKNQQGDYVTNGETGLVPCYAVFFDHIISKPVLGKDDDFKDFVAKDTRVSV